MDVESDPTTTLHPYARMEDDGEDASSTDKLSHPSTSTEAPIVTVEVRDKSTLATEPYKCIMRHFLWCCSLRSGCIAVAVLYSIYAAVYVLGSVIVFIVIEIHNPEPEGAFLLYVFFFGKYMCVFTIVLVSLGINKRDYRRLLVAKSVIGMHCILVVFVALRLLKFGSDFGIITAGICIPLLTMVYSFYVVHSYEAKNDFAIIGEAPQQIAKPLIAIFVTDGEPTTFSSKKPTERPLLGATIALYEAIIAIILIVLLSIGIRKDDTYYLHAAKWLMIFDCGLGFIENVQLAYMGYALMQVFHFCIQLIPVYFIFVVNSYEGELVSQQIIRQASFSQASVTHPS